MKYNETSLLKQGNKAHNAPSRVAQVLLLLMLPSIIFSAGCSWYKSYSNQRYNPNLSGNLKSIKTVCLVELHNSTSYPQISSDVSESLYQSLQKKQFFTLSMLQQNDAAWKNLPISPDSPYALEQLVATHKMLGTDAVLIGTVTAYRPYPHTLLGIQLKLIDLRDGRTPWSIAQVWDTADKTTEERIKKYFNRQMREGFSPLGEQLAVLSTINFVKFVTYDVVETMN
jgi:hypothetical protein